LVNVTVSLIGSNGDSLAIDNENYVLETGLRGFGIPAPVLRIDKSASNGGIFRYSKRDVRTLDLPISVIANDGEDIQVKLRRLAAILRGPVTITANYDSGEAFFIIGYYNGGAETQFGSDATKTIVLAVGSRRKTIRSMRGLVEDAPIARVSCALLE